MDRDLEHLRLLSIFHYVLAGLAALLALIPVIHLGLGVAIVTGRLPDAPYDQGLRAFGWAFIVLASLFIAVGEMFALGLALAGSCLARRTRYGFCFAMAAIACLFMPLGTVLGVFTIVVLEREAVKRLFGRVAPGPPPAPPG
jgi:hypothetical protein